MSTTANGDSGTEMMFRLGELNEQILDMSREVAKLSLDALEAAVESIAGYHEQAASRTDIGWITSTAGAQARSMRELASRYVALGRELLDGA